MSQLQSRMRKVYDHLYANSAVRTPNGIGNEVGKVLHAGIYIEEVLNHRPAFQPSRAELAGFAQNNRNTISQIASLIRESFDHMNLAWQLFEPGSTILLNDYDLCFTCVQLGGLLLSDKKEDVLGEAVEVFRSQWVKRVGGQFFTDPFVTALSMALLEFDPLKGDDLIDICAGTGGFLLAGLNHIKRILDKATPNVPVESQLVTLARSSLAGQEIDPEVCDAANSTLRARLGPSGNSLVVIGDSLREESFTGKSHLRLGHHICAASNPPFGTKITVKDPDILNQYELAKVGGSRNHNQLSPQPPDILFLERNLQMLKPEQGRLAIVLPYQLLSGPKALFVRHWLLRHARIRAVIDLPPETFQPYTGTKTALLVIERFKKPIIDLKSVVDYSIFMSIPRWIGHDRRGNPVYKRSLEGKVTDSLLSDFDEVERAFDLHRLGKHPQKAHAASFIAKFSSIAQDPLLRINALFHKPPIEASKEWCPRNRVSGWTSYRLSDLVKDIFYPGRFKRNYVEYFPGAVPFLGGSNVTEFIARTDKWLRPDNPHLNALRIYAGWILVTRSGTTGIVAMVPRAWDGFAMSEHVIRIIPDYTKISPAYLLAFLRSKYGQEQLARGVFGSVIDEITPEFLGDIEVHFPTSRDLVNKIIELVDRSEEAKQIGIENHAEAVERMNAILSD